MINKLFREYNLLWKISHRNLDNLNKKIYENISLEICVMIIDNGFCKNIMK